MISSVTDADFDAAVLGAPNPVLVKFEAPWCGPCKAMKPMLEEIAEEFREKVRIATVDIDQNGQAPSKYRVRGVPGHAFQQRNRGDAEAALHAKRSW